MKPLVMYHAHCTDGFGAAYAAWAALGDEAEYLPMSYGDALPDVTGRDVYVLDFSFDRETTCRLISVSTQFVWLDHHKTAFEMWCDTEREKYVTAIGSMYIALDNNKSGALLAWEFFHSDDEPPLIIRHIDDRDRWQFKMRCSKEVHAGLQLAKPWSFELWQQLMRDDEYGPLISAGGAALRKMEQEVAVLAKSSAPCCVPDDWDFRGHDRQSTWNTGGFFAFEGLAANSPLHMSELGHELANMSGTFGLVWYMGANGNIKCSFRSNGDYDVSAIAKQFGGGGHKNAAGCEVPVETLLGWLR